MLLSRQHEPSRGGEIEDLRLAGNFKNDSRQRRRGKAFETSPQSAGGVGGPHQNEEGRIEPEVPKSGGIDVALFEGRIVLPDPEEMFLLRFMLQQKVQHKCSKTIPRSASGRLEDFMQGASSDPSAKRTINAGMA